MPKNNKLRKIKEAQMILKELGLPPAQQNDMAALTLLSLAGVTPKGSWDKADRKSVTVTKGIMDFISSEYAKQYAPNTRETVRRQVLHQFVQAHLADYNPDQPDLPTNSPRAHYALTKDVLATIQTFDTDKWRKSLEQFLKKHGSLAEKYRKRRNNDNLVPIVVEGKKFLLSPGKHNEVQAAVIQEFAPRFAPGTHVLYLGDTANKDLFVDSERLQKIGIPVTEHDKLPDIMLLDEGKGWIFLIEVVTSHGPVTPKRVVELEEALSACTLKKIYITAFPDLGEFKQHARDIAWESEVWLADIPDHMIHFNGDRFLGPHK